MEPLSLCVNTQTPLFQFLPSAAGGPPSGRIIDLEDMQEGTDYRVSPGGVTRMVYPMVRRLLQEKVLQGADWVSLNPEGPERVRTPGLTLHNVRLAPEQLTGYGQTKEAILLTVHGSPASEADRDLFWTGGFSEFAYYNRMTAERIRQIDQQRDFDLFYIHDFQQIAVGQMLNTLKPHIFRWHVPFELDAIPDEWGHALLGYLNDYDLIVASTRRYVDALARFGVSIPMVVQHPYVDPTDYHRPDPEAVEAAMVPLGVQPKEKVILVVGRMDPVKGQDLALKAFAPLARRRPELRMVIVGNGSFSGSAGGLQLSKSGRWRQRLEELTKELRIGAQVTFTGHVSQATLDGLYERSLFTMLPSVQEGFGLVVVESWLHLRPVIVSDRAGITELVRDGANALLVDPTDVVALRDRMERLLTDSALRRRLGRAGTAAARKCSVGTAVRSETQILAQAMGG